LTHIACLNLRRSFHDSSHLLDNSPSLGNGYLGFQLQLLEVNNAAVVQAYLKIEKSPHSLLSQSAGFEVFHYQALGLGVPR
jgi:hypothetical protein